MNNENSEKTRLFTAISLTWEFVEVLNNLRTKYNIKGNINWTKPENLHITTCFIGETEKNLIDETKNKIIKIIDSIPNFRLEYRNIQLAPPKKKPYMIWANYNTNDTFIDLCGQMHSKLLNLQKRNHYPHVTLARFKGYLRFNNRHINEIFPAIEVSKIGLWNSELTKNGPIYELLEEFPLKS